MASNTNKVVSNSFWNILNTILTLISGIILSVVVARFLGPDKTGVYNYFLWLINIFVLVIGIGGNSTILKYTAEFLSKRQLEKAAFFLKNLFLTQISFGLIFIVLVFYYFSKLELQNNFNITFLLIALASILPYLFTSSFTSILQGAQKYKVITKINAFILLLTLILIPITLIITGSVFYLLVINLIIFSISFFVYFFISKKYFMGKSLRISKTQIKQIISYASSIYLITIIDTVVWQKSEIFFLGFFSKSDQIAFYSIAYGLANMLIVAIAGAFNNALVPVFTQLQANGKANSLQIGYYRTTKLLSLIIIPAAAGLLVLSPKVISLIYGDLYLSSSSIFNILIIPIALAAIAGSGSALIYSLNKQWFIIRWGIPLAFLNILLDLSLIPRFAGIGAAVANSTTQILGLLIGSIYVVYFLKMPFPFKSFFKILAASSIMTLALFTLPYFLFNTLINIVFSIVIGILVYLLSIITFKVLDKTDLLMLKSIDSRFIKSGLFLKFLSYIEKTI